MAAYNLKLVLQEVVLFLACAQVTQAHCLCHVREYGVS